MAYCVGCNEDNATLTLNIEGRGIEGKHLHTKQDQRKLCEHCYENYMNHIEDILEDEDGSYEV